MPDDAVTERVARAIARADERNGGPPYEHRIALGKHAKEQLFDQARAAIEEHERAKGCVESYRDKRIEDMSRDDLVEALKTIGALYNEALRANVDRWRV